MKICRHCGQFIEDELIMQPELQTLVGEDAQGNDLVEIDYWCGICQPEWE